MADEKTSLLKKYGIPALTFVGGIIFERYLLPKAEKWYSGISGNKRDSKPMEPTSALYNLADLLDDTAQNIRKYARDKDFQSSNK